MAEDPAEPLLRFLQACRGAFRDGSEGGDSFLPTMQLLERMFFLSHRLAGADGVEQGGARAVIQPTAGIATLAERRVCRSMCLGQRPGNVLQLEEPGFGSCQLLSLPGEITR